MKKIKWKKAKGGRAFEHLLEGHVDDKHLFTIEGRLCVTDLRPIKSEPWNPPKHYSIVDKEDGKRIAHDLLNNLNQEEHEANLKAMEERDANTIRVLQEAQELLDKIDRGELD